jgi:hypothetical protein
VTSTPGQGTTFCVRLPIPEDESARVQTGADRAGTP